MGKLLLPFFISPTFPHLLITGIFRGKFTIILSVFLRKLLGKFTLILTVGLRLSAP